MRRSFFVIFTMIFLLTSCNPHETRYTDHFTYEIWGDSVIIMGLTKLGNEQEFIIIPEKIDNMYVISLGQTGSAGTWQSARGSFSSEKLKRVYLQTGDIEIPDSFFNTLNLDMIASLGYRSDSQVHVGFDIQQSRYLSVTVSSKLFEEHPDQGFLRANVSYMYNLPDTPFDGYYFIDNYDNEVIQFIPPDPIIEGKTFVGWYKDIETTIPWEFASDIIPEILDNTYIETKLYAKWS